MVKECVHIDTGRYYAAKVINKRMMAGREHMVCRYEYLWSYKCKREITMKRKAELMMEDLVRQGS